MPMISGAQPATAIASMRASGFRPLRLRVILGAHQHRRRRRRSAARRCRRSPCRSASKAGFSPARPFERGVGRGCSRPSRPSRCPCSIGTISASNLPVGLRRRRLLLARERELLLPLARDLVFLREVLGRLAHRHVGLRACARRAPGCGIGLKPLIGTRRHRSRRRRRRRPRRRPSGSRRPPCGSPASTSRRSG